MLNKLFFINRNYKFLPIIALYALGVSALVFLFADTTLTSFTFRNIGEAAMRGIDINKRLYFVYLCFVAFVASILLLWVFYKNRLEYFSEAHKDVLFYSSLFLVSNVFIKMYSSSWEEFYRQPISISSVLGLFPEVLPIVSLHIFIHCQALLFRYEEIRVSVYLQRFIASIAITTWLIQLCTMGLFARPLVFSIFWLVAPFVSMWFFNWKNSSSKLLLPLAWLPVLSVLSTELFLILNAHGIYFLSTRWFFIVFSIFVFVYIYLVVKKVLSRSFSEKKYYLNYLVSFLALGLYTPFVNHSAEMFENANAALGLQQYFSFGKIPLVDTFNSHLLSEYFYAFIYSFVNGFNVKNGLAYEAYNFLHPLLMGVLVYLVSQRMFGSLRAFIFSFFISVVTIQLPVDYSIVLIIPLLFFYSRQRHRSWRIWLFAGSVALMFLWAIDIGISVLIASWATLMIFIPNRKSRRIYFKYILSGFILLIFAGIIVCRISGVEFVKIFSQIYFHYDAAQAYGYKALAIKYDGLFFMHYVFFPLAIIIIVGMAWKRTRNSKTLSLSDLAQYRVLVFLSVFYLVNFHRGLVRHALVEHTDLVVSSFVFFIIPLAIYTFTNKLMSDRLRWLVFVINSFAMIFMFKYPFADLPEIRTCFEQSLNKTNFGINPIDTYKPIQRSCIPDSFADVNYSEIKRWLDLNVAPNQSFIDFSNTPMLYFYTNRRTVSYFNQFPNMLHNDKLQRSFVADAIKDPAPVCIFSNAIPTWYDHPDEVPNQVRHYLIAEYIYTHYRPLDTLNGKSIWVYNSSVNIKDSLKPSSIEHYDLMLLPYIWYEYGQREGEVSYQVIESKAGKELEIVEQPLKLNGNYIDIEMLNETQRKHDVTLFFGHDDNVYGSFSFQVLPKSEPQSYRVRVSTQYNWYRNDINKITLSLPEGVKSKAIKLLSVNP